MSLQNFCDNKEETSAMEAPKLDDLLSTTDFSDLRKASSLWGWRFANYFLLHMLPSISSSGTYCIPFSTYRAARRLLRLFSEERFRNTLCGNLTERTPHTYILSLAGRRPSEGVVDALCVTLKYNSTMTLEG